MTRRDYLLAELRCASLRAQQALADIEAIRLALEGGLITPDQAVELLADCDLFRFIEPAAPPTEPDATHEQVGGSWGPEWAESARQYHENRRSAPKPVPSKVPA